MRKKRNSYSLKDMSNQAEKMRKLADRRPARSNKNTLSFSNATNYFRKIRGKRQFQKKTKWCFKRIAKEAKRRKNYAYIYASPLNLIQGGSGNKISKDYLKVSSVGEILDLAKFLIQDGFEVQVYPFNKDDPLPVKIQGETRWGPFAYRAMNQSKFESGLHILVVKF